MIHVRVGEIINSAFEILNYVPGEKNVPYYYIVIDTRII